MMNSPKILDGKWLAGCIQEQIRSKISSLSGRAPGLGVILVGDDPASHVYVSNKEKTAANCGLKTFNSHLPADTNAEKLEEVIKNFNSSAEIDGILLQLPLPKHLKPDQFIELISPEKDVDGLHPVNQGLLLRGQGELRPCTPLGAMALIDLALSKTVPGDPHFSAANLAHADLSGVRAVVVGRSILVGKPVVQLLLERNATVTIAHSKTKDLPSVCREADILIAAVGRAELIKGDWVKPGAIVIDVGINRTAAGKIVGDVEFASASLKASAISPVPKGVGPLTITMLINNTLKAYLKKQ